MRRALIVLWLVACGADERPAPKTGVGCTLAAVNSDYNSTAISLLNDRGELCVDAVLTSGSAPTGLVTALSGDVVLPGSLHPDGLLVLVDRFPNSVVTLLDADIGVVVRQIGVGTGFAANPQDVWWRSRTEGWVTRLEKNPTPGDQAFDEGDDILVIDGEAGVITGRIPLTAEAPAGFLARAHGMVAQGGEVWAALAVIAEDFMSGTDSRLLAISPETRVATANIQMTGFRGCNGVAARGETLFVVCSGLFADGDQQVSGSGVVVVDAESHSIAWSRHAMELGIERPLSFVIEPESEDAAWVISFGDAGDRDDTLWRIRRDQPAEPFASSDGFALGTQVISGGVIMVPDADPKAPRLLRIGLDGAALPPVDLSPGTGLPGRHVRRFRHAQ